MNLRFLKGGLPVLPVFLLVMVLGLLPFVHAGISSLFHDSYGVITWAGLDNFREITGDDGFRFSLKITVVWSAVNVLLSLAGGFCLALILVSDGVASTGLFRILLIPWAVPIYIAVPLWRAFLHGSGGVSLITRLTGLHFNLMTDALAGFSGAVLVNLWMAIPMTAFVLAGHMRQASRETIEAASLDGAGSGQIARYIHLPEILPSLTVMAVLNFIKAYKEFNLVFMLTSGGPPLVSGITENHIIGATTTLGIFLYEVFQTNSDWGISAAQASLMSLSVLLIMGIWYYLRKNRSVKGLVFSMAILILMSGRSVYVFLTALLYMISFFYSPLLPAAFLFQALSQILLIIRSGFFTSFHPSVILGLFVLFLHFRLLREKGSLKMRSSRLLIPLSRITSLIFIGLTLLILSLLVWMSFSGVSACYMDSLIPPGVTPANYSDIFLKEGLLRYLGNTLVIAGMTVAILPLIIFPSAVWMNSLGRKKTLLILGFIQMTAMAGGLHSLIPLYRIFNAAGLVNTWVPLVLIYLNQSLPLSLFILTAFLETVPSGFHDLSRMEGLSLLQYSFHVLLPLSLPPLLTVVMTSFLGAWNGFLPPLLFLNDENLYPVSLKLHSWVGNLGSSMPVWNYFAAASVINVIFTGLLFYRFKNPMAHSPLSDISE